MTNREQARRMFDRTNSFLISVNQVSKISNEEIVKRLVKGLLFCKVTYTKAFNAIYDNIENLTKVEFVKVTVNRMEDTLFKLDFEKVTSLNELAKSYFIIYGCQCCYSCNSFIRRLTQTYQLTHSSTGVVILVLCRT